VQHFNYEIHKRVPDQAYWKQSKSKPDHNKNKFSYNLVDLKDAEENNLNSADNIPMRTPFSVANNATKIKIEMFSNIKIKVATMKIKQGWEDCVEKIL